MERDEIDFGTLKVSVLFRKLFIPKLFGMLSISAVTVADGIFVGHGVGSDGIAAVNIYVPLLMLFQGVGLMIGIGCSVVASIHLSRAKVKAARLNVTQAMIIVTALTLLLSLLIVVFPDRTACLLGSSDRLLPLVKDYLLWFTPALVFQMWTAVGLFVIRLDGAPKLAMWCSVVAALLNVVLDWLFIFPLGWGVMGAAFATAISVSVGGVIVDSGNFNWENGKFGELCTPDESYHGVTYTRDFGRAAYITKARVQLMRDFGMYPSAQDAFLLNLGLETLAVRMERYCRNAEQAAAFLARQPAVEFVNYPALSGSPYAAAAKKYLPDGCSGVISFSIRGGREVAVKFMDSLSLANKVVHVADICTCVLHPASSTHRQLTDEQLVAAGITPGLIRLSVGLEHIDDILDDLKKGFAAIR